MNFAVTNVYIECRKWLKDETLFPILLQVYHDDQSWKFLVNLDRKKQRFILIVNDSPFMQLPFASATAIQVDDRIIQGKLSINSREINDGVMHWCG